MKKKSTSKSAFFNLRVLIASVLCLFGVFVALIGFGLYPGAPLLAQSQVSNRHNNGNPIGLSFTRLTTTSPRPCAKWQPGLCHLLVPENMKARKTRRLAFFAQVEADLTRSFKTNS